MGRKKLPMDILKKRGSRHVRERKKAARKKPVPPKIEPVAAKILSAAKIKAGIPNYDPTVGADDYKFVYGKAKKAIEFFHNELRHVKGELTGQPFILEPWEQAIIGNLFGWVHKKTGLRRYRKTLIFVPKKNGKTPLAAGIILYLLFEDGEPGAEIYGAATEYKQASLVFTHAWGMRNQNPELSERSHVFKGQSKAMELGQPGDMDYGIYRVISGESDSCEGFNTQAVVVDELHKQKTRELTDNLETSTAARREPLVIYITTSDFEREGSICNETQDYAERLLKHPEDNPAFLPVIYKAEIEDDWTDPKVWYKANPNLGVSVSYEHIERECKRAQDTPTFENTFKRLHLNIRTGQDVRWLSVEEWDKCDGVVLPEALIGHSCYAGLDLSSRKDVTAIVLYFPDEKKVLPFFWIPKANAHQREKTDKVPYTTWANQDFITMTPGNVIDYAVVMGGIADIAEKYNIELMAFDRWGFEAIRQQLVHTGVPEEKMIAFGQGYASMSAPTKELEKLVLGEEISHGGHPVLRDMASKVAVVSDSADNIKPCKKKSTGRIDGIVGLIMAIGLAITQPEKVDMNALILEVGI